MSKEKKLIPELRFPEFLKEGEWELNPFSDYIKLYRGSSPRPIRDYLTHRDDGVNWIKIGDTGSVNDFVIRNVAEKITPKGAEYSRKVKKGELILANSMSYGKTYQLALDGCIYDGWFVLREFEEVFNKQFLLQALNSDYTQEQYKKFAAGGIVQNISSEIVYSTLLPRTSVKEQKKTASCLSSLDELITAHNDKLEALKDHKKGLMQNLFPQMSGTGLLRLKDEQDEDEILSISSSYKPCSDNLPKFRFPEFESDGEWVEKALDEVAVITKGKGISKSDIVENGNLPCIRYGELYTDYSETISDIKSYTNIDGENLVLSEENDVIIPASGETHIDIARASCVMRKGVALGGDLNIIKTKINGVFLAYYLNNAKKRDIAQIAQGISVVHLYANQLKTLVLNLPKPKEQQKIASCLSAVDELITAQSEKIEQLQQHKKGLMQGLFPKIV